jgi:hypothetical protein
VVMELALVGGVGWIPGGFSSSIVSRCVYGVEIVVAGVVLGGLCCGCWCVVGL